MMVATLAERETQREFIARALADEHGIAKDPAFYDQDMLISLSMKYRVLEVRTRAGEWKWTLQPEQNLSAAGFERNISNCTDSDGNWCDFVTFNPGADAMRVKWLARVRAERLADEARKAKIQAERDAHAMREAENRATIETMLSAAKFKRQSVTLAMDNSDKVTDSSAYIHDLLEGAKQSHTFQGLAIHRIGKEWRITHISSGLSVGLAYGTLTEAKVAVVRLTALTDWTHSGQAVVAALKGNNTMSTIRHNVYAIVD